MKLWKRMMVTALTGAMVLSQGMAAFAEDVEIGAGEDILISGGEAPQQGAGIDVSIVGEIGNGEKEGLAGSTAMGSTMDLSNLEAQAGNAWGMEEDTDTVVLDDIGLELRIQGSYMLQNSEDQGFYYIDTWGEHGIPNMMVGAFQDNTTDSFFDRYTSYMQESRPDLTIAEGPADVTVGDKNLQKIVYNYGIQGYTVRDTRYIWLAPNDVLYMFTKREIPELDFMLGSQLEDIISATTLMGSHNQGPQPETTAPVPETTAPQPETNAPAPQSDLYVQNDDSSWTVTTDYYTMTIPPAWTGHFDAALSQSNDTGYNLQVVSKESADAGFGGHLFTIMLIPQSEDYTYLPSYDYLGTMSTPEGTFSVVVQYPTDVQTGDVWTEFYKILNGDKNTAISSMRPNAGIVWTLPDGNVIGSSTQTTAPQPETTTPQPETTAPQPETTAPGPEIADPPVVTSPTGDPLGTTSTAGYSNDLFGFSYLLPAGWIQANQDQLVTLNQGLTADQFRTCIEAGVPVCVAYAQSANGMEVMNVVVENGASFMDPGVQSLTQEDVKEILNEAMSISTSSLEELGATVTGAAVNTVNCMGQTFYSLDINFDYAGMSGTQKQIGIPAGTYIALVTVRSVSGDNTQTMLDMFSAS